MSSVAFMAVVEGAVDLSADPGPPRDAILPGTSGTLWDSGSLGPLTPGFNFPKTYDATALVRLLWGVKKWRWTSAAEVTFTDPENPVEFLSVSLTGLLTSTADDEEALEDGIASWEGTASGDSVSTPRGGGAASTVTAESDMRLLPIAVSGLSGATPVDTATAYYDRGADLFLPRLEIRAGQLYSPFGGLAVNYPLVGGSTGWDGTFDGVTTQLLIPDSAGVVINSLTWSLEIAEAAGYWPYTRPGGAPRFNVNTGAELIPHYPG